MKCPENRKFSADFGVRSPDQLGPEEIRSWQLFLLREKRVKLTSYIQAISALRFFFGITLNRQIGIERIPLVSGPAGATVGWGYQLTNNSATDWFVPTDLNTDSSFPDGTPTLLFDFPDLAPNTTAMETFDPVNSIGLYQFTWDPSVPGGSVNSGNFVLSGEWWDGDPLNGGNFIADIDTSAAYTATINSSSSSSPEPSSLAMAMSGLCVLIVIWRRGGRVREMVR